MVFPDWVSGFRMGEGGGEGIYLSLHNIKFTTGEPKTGFRVGELKLNNMDTGTFVSNLLFGGLLGIIGQSIRVIVGLKKTYSLSLQTGQKFASVFDGRQLLVSLFIGFISGALGIITMINFKNNQTEIITKEFVVGLVAIGYSGTDFIEGVIKKNLP
jgi:hypothetical protein